MKKKKKRRNITFAVTFLVSCYVLTVAFFLCFLGVEVSSMEVCSVVVCSVVVLAAVESVGLYLQG